MHDLSAISELGRLRFILLYGLPKVSTLPSLAGLSELRRAELGQMLGLQSLKGLLAAPALRELLLLRKINVSGEDVAEINSHPTLERFDWFAEDVPDRVWIPVKESIRRPEAEALHPEEWFSRNVLRLTASRSASTDSRRKRGTKALRRAGESRSI
jgi:hypothetical protein